MHKMQSLLLQRFTEPHSKMTAILLIYNLFLIWRITTESDTQHQTHVD